MHMNTKTRTNIYLTEEQRAGLTALSQQTGAPVAEIVRRAVDAYLEKEREKNRPEQPKKK
jgi:predicted DNA-binding protein